MCATLDIGSMPAPAAMLPQNIAAMPASPKVAATPASSGAIACASSSSTAFDVALPRRVSQAGRASSECLALVIDGVLSAAECASLVAVHGDATKLKKVTEAAGEGYSVAIQNPRNYSLGVFHDAGVSDGLWARLEARAGAALAAFADSRGERPPLGLNERLRVLRYAPGERFEPHYDLVVDYPPDRRSLVTVLVYLTDGFEGGDTAFLDAAAPSSSPAAVAPRVGRVVLFEHGLFHSGQEVVAGVKYVLRTDVLFEARDPPAAAEAAPTAPPPPPPPPAVGDVAGLLASLGLGRCRGAVECLGLEGASLDALLAPGRAATAAMLAELDVADDDVGALLDAAEAALKGS